MKKLMMLCIAVAFFASFTLVSCGPSAEPPKPAPTEEAKPAAPEPAPAPDKAPEAAPAPEKAPEAAPEKK